VRARIRITTTAKRSRKFPNVFTMLRQQQDYLGRQMAWDWLHELSGQLNKIKDCTTGPAVREQIDTQLAMIPESRTALRQSKAIPGPQNCFSPRNLELCQVDLRFKRPNRLNTVWRDAADLVARTTEQQGYLFPSHRMKPLEIRYCSTSYLKLQSTHSRTDRRNLLCEIPNLLRLSRSAWT
jgi:hypothetical protein